MLDIIKQSPVNIVSHLAERWSTDPESVNMLPLSELSLMKAVCSHDPSTPTQYLAQLALDPVEAVRVGVAENPATPANVLRFLSKDSSSEVRAEVAGNPSSPADSLVRLSSDRSDWVLSKLAHNPSTPSSVLDVLTRYEARFATGVVTNPSCPAGLLVALVADNRIDPEGKRISDQAFDVLQQRYSFKARMKA